MQDLPGILAVSKQALNAPLRRLVDENLVGMRADAVDRRFRRLTLTAEGRKLESHLTRAQTRLLESVFAAAGARGESAWKAVMRALPLQSGAT